MFTLKRNTQKGSTELLKNGVKVGQFVFGGCGSFQNGTYGETRIVLEDINRKLITAKTFNGNDYLKVFKEEIAINF